MRNTLVRRVVSAVAVAAAAFGFFPATTSAQKSIILEAECVYTDAAGVRMPPARSNRLTLTVRERLQWLANWLVNGPHYPGSGGPSVWWDALGGEAYLSPHDGMVSRSRAWRSASADQAGILDFGRCFGESRLTVGYAHSYIHSPVDQQALLLAGSDDSLRVYLNGKSVFSKNANRVLEPDQDRVSVNLRAGINRLLLKSTKWSGDWRVCARLESAQKVSFPPPPNLPAGDWVFYVRADAAQGGDGQSWDAALPDIQAAIDLAAEAGGGQVWVAAGVYARSIRLRPFVRVYGGFAGFESAREERDPKANPTLVRAGGASYAVRGADESVLDGVGITGGSYGVYCDGASPLVRGCDIYGCETGVMATNDSAPGIFASRIYANKWYGVQCHFGSSAVIRRCVISGNDRLAVYCYTNSNAEISDSVIDRNGLHGVFVEYSSPRVSNCTIVRNGGYAVHSRGSKVTLVNSIVSANGWAGGGAIALVAGSAPVVGNSCFWDNGPGQFAGLDSPVGQSSNIQEDPCFLDLDSGLYPLGAGSPCIDAGDNACVVGDTDLWGRRRVARRTVDLGAVEAQ